MSETTPRTDILAPPFGWTLYATVAPKSAGGPKQKPLITHYATSDEVQRAKERFKLTHPDAVCTVIAHSFAGSSKSSRSKKRRAR
jgi:hypothetical protein